MQIAIVRHAIALDRDDAEKQRVRDACRPLTDRGREKMLEAARGLTTVLDCPTLLASSPWLRARDTAEIIAAAYGGPTVTETKALLPGHLQRELLEWLATQRIGKTAVVVGHEPDLGLWAGWLLSGRPLPLLRLKKGSACLIEFDRDAAPGRGELRWLLTSRQLRKLGQ